MFHLPGATREMDEKTRLEGNGGIPQMSIIFKKKYQAMKGLYLVSLDLSNNFIGLDMVTFACNQRRRAINLGQFN